jgi:DNA-binding NtrC family response regulator
MQSIDRLDSFFKKQIAAGRILLATCQRDDISDNRQRMKSQSFFIGNSPIAQALRRLVSTIANSNATVLITGESGTGKE